MSILGKEERTGSDIVHHKLPLFIQFSDLMKIFIVDTDTPSAKPNSPSMIFVEKLPT